MSTKDSPYLYRILSFRHVVDFFEKKELHFTAPAEWEDPYEKVLSHRRSHAFYAQCWCKKAVSDAMWRIYSADRTSVRIRTTRGKLSSALRAAKQDSNIGFLVKDVEYVSSSKIDARISQIARELATEFDIRRAADALLLKRDAFDHEEEVRVIINDKNATDTSKSKPFLRIPVNPDRIIDSIFFDPRSDETFVRVCTHYLKNAVMFQGTIGKSALYRTREQVVVE